MVERLGWTDAPYVRGMKELLPPSAITLQLLDDGDVLEIRWCRTCERGRRKPENRQCPSCDGHRVVRTVRKET